MSDVLRLTPTPRLARSLLRADAAQQRAASAQSWTPQPTLTFNAFIHQLWQAQLLLGNDDRVPISSEQSLTLWQQLVADAVFVGDRDVATLAHNAWRRLHEFALEAPDRWQDAELNVDTDLFRRWAADYVRHCDAHALLDEWRFAAELPTLLRASALPLPATIELIGFDLAPTPLQQQILDALAASGVAISGIPELDLQGPATVDVLRVFDTAEAELESAARWARATLEADPEQRLAIVVPDLSSRVASAERILMAVLESDAWQLERPPGPLTHISLGQPLAAYPLVADALAVLALAPDHLTQPEAQWLLRCPWLPGADSESSARSNALLAIVQKAPYRLTLAELLRIVDGAGAKDLSDLLGQWQNTRAETPALLWPSGWTRYWQTELTILGFGHGRTLGSEAFQVLARWHELLDDFASLDAVLEAPLRRQDALARLRHRCTATVFRRRNAGAAIEVLGIDEALGSRFDAAWITTLDHAAWPGQPQRDPMLPARVQRSVPKATVDGCLARARQELVALGQIAPKLFGSYAEGLEETPLAPTPLIATSRIEPMPRTDPDASAHWAPQTRDALGPALTRPQERGGASLLQHQHDCPFRAFAQHRLGATEVRTPRPGLDALQRGNLIHRALELLWSELEDSHGLAALSAAELRALTDRCAAEAVLELRRRHRLALSEQQAGQEIRRISAAVGRWLERERERPAFRVLAREAKVPLHFGALRLNGRIDRIDQLADGRRLLIDYKSSQKQRSAWEPGTALMEPQLPAYAVSTGADGIAFALVRSNKAAFTGVADGATDIAGIQDQSEAHKALGETPGWQPLVNQWRAQLEALAAAFAAGDATVTPRAPAVCMHCHLRAACRLRERTVSFGVDSDSKPDG